MKISFVYILANKYRTTSYIRVTSDLKKRVLQHKLDMGSGFTSKYNTKDLVYFEEFMDIRQAILREKQLKNWHHDWKINLIKQQNPLIETLDL